MSSINSRVPPLRLAAVDSPSDGEVAAYQSSSGQFEWVANGSGGGGTVSSVGLTETGSALTITGSPITGAGTFNIEGAGTSSQVILGDLSLGTLPTGTVSSVGSSQAFISITNPTTTPSISIGNASTSATGVLTATDWNTFNNKGSGTVSSVALSESGSALSISGSPITGSGTINISGAGTSSQVILGDLSLGTLPTGTVSSVALTESGSALSISGSPITGSGTLNISGAGTSSQVILGDLSLGTLTSGTITGTGSANQVSYWTAASVQAGSTGLTYNPSTGDLTVGGYVETGTKITTPSGTNLELVPGGASSGSIVIADGANGEISLNPNGTGTVKIDGVQIDNSAIATGYVLKATSATAAGWAAESGGGGGGLKIPNSFGTTLTGTFGDGECLGLGIGLGAIGTVNPNASSWANGLTRIRPHIMMQTGTLSTAKIWINAQPTGGVDQNWIIGMWNMGTDNKVGTLKATATIICLEGGSTGITSGTWTAETGEDLSVANGETYFIGYYSQYGASSTAVKVYFVPQSAITAYPARRPNANTGATSTPCRVYGSAGDPSSLGDNPTITGADTQSTSAWPFMWYEVV